MVNDVNTLLEQLGQKDFEYKVFTDSVEAPGYWPIFRLVVGNQTLSHLPGARRVMETSPADIEDEHVLMPVPRVQRQDPASRIYSSSSAAQQTSDARPAASGGDIRALLLRLSEMDGKL